MQLQRVKALNLYMNSLNFSKRVIYAHRTLGTVTALTTKSYPWHSGSPSGIGCCPAGFPEVAVLFKCQPQLIEVRTGERLAGEGSEDSHVFETPELKSA